MEFSEAFATRRSSNRKCVNYVWKLLKFLWKMCPKKVHKWSTSLGFERSQKSQQNETESRKRERAITRYESWARLCVQRNKRKVWFKIEVKKLIVFFSLKNVNNKNKQYNYTHTQHTNKNVPNIPKQRVRERTWTSSRLVALFDRC